MGYRVAINGFGRIGRGYLRCLLDRQVFGAGVRVVGINDLWDPATLAHLLRVDSTGGPLRATVTHDDEALTVAGHRVPVLREPDPKALPWADLGVDLVIEATGRFRTGDDAAPHLKAGADRVLVTAAGRGVDATLVPGVNTGGYDPLVHRVVAAGSRTTACAVPMAKVLNDAFGVLSGHLTVAHAYTNEQSLLDTAHADPRRARSATVNIIPTGTGAPRALGEVLPALAGRLSGVSLRVPVENGSLVQLTCELLDAAAPDQVNAAFAAAARCTLPGILRYSDQPMVSRDILGDPASCVFDAGLTRTDGGLASVFGWFDNECGYAHRLVDLTELFAGRR